MIALCYKWVYDSGQQLFQVDVLHTGIICLGEGFFQAKLCKEHGMRKELWKDDGLFRILAPVSLLICRMALLNIVQALHP